MKPAEVSQYVNRALLANEEELSSLLGLICNGEEFDDGLSARWTFPKSDLFHWVALLDRFDAILERHIDEHWDKETMLQKCLFPNQTLLLVVRILLFSRLLLENCTSRNIYCSYDKLKKLLVTDDMLALEKTLELLIIPARKLDSQHSLRNTFEREVGTNELVTLSQLNLPFLPEMGEVEVAKFALRFKEHHSGRLAQFSATDAVRSQYIKMLATSIYLMAQPDGTIDSAFFALSPTLIRDTSKLVSALPNGSMKMELAAISILRSCLKSSSRWSEIMHALTISASHGPIISIFRCIVDSLVSEAVELPYPPMFIHGYIDFVGILVTQVEMDDALVTAGFVSETIRSLEVMSPKHYKIYEKSLYILDALAHHYPSALDTIFMNNGLNFIVRQVTMNIEEAFAKKDPQAPQDLNSTYGKSVILQSLLRFLDKLLSSNGSDDRLRNLLESHLFKSFVQIFNGPASFSPEIVTHAISITASFIHNEPTSLSVLQELGVPQALLQCVKNGTPSSVDFVMKIPYAFSAVCLNAAGTEQFKQVEPITALSNLFLQPDTVKILKTRSTASNLGTAMDEFIRHHPQFKSLVLGSVIATMQQAPERIQILMGDPEYSNLFLGSTLMTRSIGTVKASEKRAEPFVSQLLETLSAFLDGLLQTAAHRIDFFKAKGVKAFLDVFHSPGISFDFTVFNESLSVSHLLRALGSDKTDSWDQYIISGIVSNWVERAEKFGSFLSEDRQSSFFAPVLSQDIPCQDLTERVSVFQTLSSSLAMIGLFRDLYSNQSYHFSYDGSDIVAVFASEEGEAAIVLMTLLLKVTTREFKLFLSSIDEATFAAVYLKAKNELKAPVFATFSTALLQVYAKSSSLLDEEKLREQSMSSTPAIVQNVLHISFVLQRLMTSVSAVYSGLSKALSFVYERKFDREFPDDDVDKLSRLLAKGALSIVSWLQNLLGDTDAPLDFKCYMTSHMFQFLGVVLFEEPTDKTGCVPYNHIVNTFIDSGGLKILGTTVQTFIGVISIGDSLAPESGHPLKDLMSFLDCCALTNRNLKEGSPSKTLREFAKVYCLEYFSWPLSLRQQLPSMIHSEVLSCLTSLSHDRSEFSSLDHEILAKLTMIITESIACSGETVVEISKLIKTLVANSLPSPSELYGVVYPVGDDTLKRVEATFGWVLSSSCPLPEHTRLRLLASSLDTTILRCIYPQIIVATSFIVEAVKDALGRGDAKSIAAGLLLLGELVYSTLIPILETSGKERYTLQLDAQAIQGLCELAVSEDLCSLSSDIDVALGSLYLLGALTRSSQSHSLLDIRTLFPYLVQCSLLCLTTKDRRYRTLATLSTIIIRHLIESPEYVKLMVESELCRTNSVLHESQPYFTFFHIIGYDAPMYRDFASFREALLKHYELTWDSPEWVNPAKDCSLSRKKAHDPSLPSPTAPSIEELQNLALSPNSLIVISSIMDILLSETTFPSSQSAEENEAAEADDITINAHFRRCYLISLLVEIIQAYPVCRKAFVESERRESLILFLLERITPSGELAGSLGSRVFVNEPMWVSQLLDELTAGPMQMTLSEKIENLHERVHMVIDPLSTALTNFSSEYGASIDTYSKMSKAWCLTMTIYVLISVKGSTGSRSLTVPLQTGIVARMAQMGVIPLLTKMLKAINSKAPMAPMLAAKIIFALEIIVRTTNKIQKLSSRAGDIRQVDQLLSTLSADEGGSLMMGDEFGEDSDIDDDDDDDDEIDVIVGDEDDLTESDMMDVDSLEDSMGGDEDTDDDMDDDDDETDFSTDDNEMSDTDEGMMYSDMDEDEEFRVILQPPPPGSAPVITGGIQSGFQVIPVQEFGSYADDGSQFFNDQLHDFEEDRDEENDDDEDDDEYLSQGSIEDEDDGFSVGDEYSDDDVRFFDENQLLSLGPRGARRGFPAQLSGMRTSYSSQTREPDAFQHPLMTGPLDVAVSRVYQHDPSRAGAAHSTRSASPSLRVWSENRDVFHTPLVVPTAKRWVQEAKIFIGTDTKRLSDYISTLLLQDFIAASEPRRAKELEQLASAPTSTNADREGSAGEGGEKAGLGQLLDSRESRGSREQRESRESRESPRQEETLATGPDYIDAGPDREFLEALPFEMRREVLEQYFQERRLQVPEGSRVVISDTFLNTLSPDLRDEYQRLSRQECDRFERRRRSNFTSVGINISDLAERINSRLRDYVRDELHVDPEALFGEAGEGNTTTVLNIPEILQSMPSIAAANATARRLEASSSSRRNTLDATMSISSFDYSKILDISSLAAILQLYYNPTMTEHRTHMRLFQHLCASESVRANLLNMLIYILEEMPDDVTALEGTLDTFINANAGQSRAKTATPKATPRKRTVPGASDPLGGSAYVIIQQRTIQILMQLVSHSVEVRSFFTTYQTAPWTIRRIERKGDKGAKSSVSSTHYPIVLLLSCLGKASFAQIPLLVEQLLHLLQIITGPLKASIQKEKEKSSKLDQKVIPDIPPQFVSFLVKSVIQSELNPKAFNYATQVFQSLAIVPSVASAILTELTDVTISYCESTIASTGTLAKVISTGEKTEINETLKGLSLSSSPQYRLLRALKILSNAMLCAVPAEEQGVKGFDTIVDTEGIDYTISATNAGNPCWSNLSIALDECLAGVGRDSELYHVATGILPAVEAFFWHVRQAIVLVPTIKASKEEEAFAFAERHRYILNSMIRTSPQLLTNGAFILLTKMPRVLDFDNKRVWFRQQLGKKSNTMRSTLPVHVRRAHVFEDSFHAIMSKSGEEVKNGRLNIKFHDEDGLDAGGVTREWFAVLSRQMFDPNNALFKVSTVDKITYQPNQTSYINPDHLLYFAFIGRIIGKAIYDGRLLDCYFTRSFYKHILGIPVDFKDLEAVDPEYFKSLTWILENDITDVIELTFSVENDDFGEVKVVDLKPDGRNIPVTEANKREYVKLVTENKLTTAIKPQIDAFLRGFSEIVSKPLISIFNEQELELLISGMPDIDVDDWKNNTEYTGYNVSSPQIQWFWRVVRSFDQEYRAKLLQFATGTSKVPLEGFSGLQGSTGVQKFQIHRDYGAKDRLPSAHTCFNQLDLPEYENYEALRNMLMKAINECGTGFGLV